MRSYRGLVGTVALAVGIGAASLGFHGNMATAHDEPNSSEHYSTKREVDRGAGEDYPISIGGKCEVTFDIIGAHSEDKQWLTYRIEGGDKGGHYSLQVEGRGGGISDINKWHYKDAESIKPNEPSSPSSIILEDDTVHVGYETKDGDGVKTAPFKIKQLRGTEKIYGDETVKEFILRGEDSEGSDYDDIVAHISVRRTD